jgi:hypothetical protein
VNTTIELKSPGEQPLRTKRPLPNLLVQGFRLALRNWPTVVWVYAVNLGFGLLAAVPFSTGLAPYLDHSLAAQRIAGAIDLSYLGELFEHLHEAGFRAIAINTAAWLNLLELLVLFILFAGTTFVFVAAEPPRLSVLLRGGIAYFWRFVRAGLLAGCIAAVILGILLAGRALLLNRLSNVYVEREMFLYSAISAAVVLLVALLVRLWWDLVEVYIVRNVMDGERRVLQAFLPALRLLGKYFFRTAGCFLLSGILGVGALALCLFLWKQFVPAHQVWLAFLLAQLGLFLLLASRFWQRGIEATLVLSIDPPIVVAEADAEDMDATPEEDMPAVASLGVSSSTSEPTLSELVQKLRTEPWGNPDAIPVVPPHSSVPSTPVAPSSADPAKVNEPQTLRLDRHATKFPLGGVPPEQEAENPGQDEAKLILEDASPASKSENPDQHATKFPLGGASPENELGSAGQHSAKFPLGGVGSEGEVGPENEAEKPAEKTDPNEPPRTGKPLP